MKNDSSKAQVVFKDELDLISEPNIKRFVLECFEKLTPDYFWDAPASSTGKNHPEISKKKHGLVLHIKLTCWWAKKLEETMDDTSISRDVLIGASLLHDLQKFGTVMKEGKPTLANYAQTHGPLLALQIEDVYKTFEIKTDSDNKYDRKVSKWIRSLICSVAWHMGKWSDKRLCQRYDKTIETPIVHLADYCASRKIDKKLDILYKYEFPYFGE